MLKEQHTVVFLYQFAQARHFLVISVSHEDKVYELVTVVQSDSYDVPEVARANNSLHSLH